MKIIFIAFSVLLALTLIVWLGFKVRPASFPAYPAQPAALDTVPLPAGLPAPVDRYYRLVYGDRVPVITSAIWSGRGVIKPFAGIPLPARFRFIHESGQNYRHYIEATLFGIPIMKVNERYVDGKSLLELPFGVTDSGPLVDQAANLGLWAETSVFPAVYLTDPRVHWKPVDDETALLVVPFEDTEETFVVRFDPETGLIRFMEVMRYRASNSAQKSLWIPATNEYGMINGILTGVETSALWVEDGHPWATFTTEELLLNVDVSEYVRSRGY